jgi:ribosomal protein S27AE
MVRRKCPVCGNYSFSSVSQEEWNCLTCGCLLTPDMNEEVTR